MLRRACVLSTAYGPCKWSKPRPNGTNQGVAPTRVRPRRTTRRGKDQHVVCLGCDLTQKFRKYGPRGGAGVNPVCGRAQVVSPAGQGLPSNQISGPL